jgi:hypothetical protein
MPAFSNIALVAVAAGTAMTAVGNIQEGNAAKKMANLQAGILEQDATQERLIAESAERDYRRGTSFMLASRRAGLAAQGVTGEGTPMLVDEDIVGEAELQALRIRTGGQAEELRIRQQAMLTRVGGRNAQSAGYVKAGSTILSGIGDAWGVYGATKIPGGSGAAAPQRSGLY